MRKNRRRQRQIYNLVFTGQVHARRIGETQRVVASMGVTIECLWIVLCARRSFRKSSMSWSVIRLLFWAPADCVCEPVFD